MASARRLSWLALGFGGVAVAALLAATLAVASRVSLAMPGVDQLLAACARVLPSTGLASVAVLGVLAVAAVVLARGLRAAARHLLAQRRLSRRLRVLSTEEVTGIRFGRIAGETPQAFCAGLLRPRIYVSEAALVALGPEELAAVLAHEDHHRRCRDPLRLAIGDTLADAFFFVPALRRLNERYRSVAELAADEAAVRRGDASTLASAMLRFAPTESSAAVGIAPERVDHLLGQPTRWDLPVLLLFGSLAVLSLLLGGALAGSTAADTVNVPMALMGSCAVLMTVAAAGAVVGAVMVVRRRRA